MTGVMTGPGCLVSATGCHGSGPPSTRLGARGNKRPTTVPAPSSLLYSSNARLAFSLSILPPPCLPRSPHSPSALAPKPSRPSVWKGNR